MSQPGKLLLLLFLLLPALLIHAQTEPPKIKFGDVSATDFEPKFYAIDSSAHAIVLAHIGEVFYEGDDRGGFNVMYKVHLRMRLMNKSAFDAATITIPLYQGANNLKENVQKLDAYTFNMENGKVERTKLERKSIFTEEVNKKIKIQKFTMPNLKEGSIIDVHYTVVSPFERNIEAWSFQREYPTLWSQYSVDIPEIYDFVVINQGYQPFALQETNTYIRNFTITSMGNSDEYLRTQRSMFTCNILSLKMAMANVPALKTEGFTTTVQNHLARVSFQLSKIKYPNTPVKNVMNNWQLAAKDLLQHPNFGEELNTAANWLKEELKNITAGTSNKIDAARAIYAFVRDGFTCTSTYGVYKSQSFKKTLQSKSGTVADINLLLTAMLRAQGLEASPVIVSTRSNGFMSDIYPIEEKMNYVITQVIADDQTILLDASHRKLGFGKLPQMCYNGNARLIDLQPNLVNLSADKLNESKFTSIFLSSNNNKLSGTIRSTLGTFESIDTREVLAKSPMDDFAMKIKRTFPEHITVSGVKVDSLNNFDEPVGVEYNIEMDVDNEIIYLNPLFGEAQKDNPFKAAERFYPVEMPYAFNETVVCRILIPEGYEIDEIPTSRRVHLNETDGMFEYLLAKDGQAVQLKSTIKLNKANFVAEDYAILRDFFAFIVKCHSEQIVLKKVKG